MGRLVCWRANGSTSGLLEANGSTSELLEANGSTVGCWRRMAAKVVGVGGEWQHKWVVGGEWRHKWLVLEANGSTSGWCWRRMAAQVVGVGGERAALTVYPYVNSTRPMIAVPAIRFFRRTDGSTPRTLRRVRSAGVESAA
jgi:hypothetical protein